MASLLVPGGVSFTLQTLASSSSSSPSSSGRRDATNSRGRAGAARGDSAVVASLAALPVGGSLALRHATKLRFQFSSSSCSRFRCNAKLVQDDHQQSGSSSSAAEPGKMGAATVSEEGSKQELQGIREGLRRKTGNFWQNFREQHLIYKRERETWGLGFSPIFTIHEDAEGNRYQVDVNEEEILVRSGFGPNTSQFPDDSEYKALAEKRIELAKGHARDIQLGLVTPSPLSVLYQYKKENASSPSHVGDTSWPWTSSDAPSVAPLQILSLLTVLLAVAFLGMGVKWLFSKTKPEDDPAHEKNLRLMQMRKLKAQISRESSEGTATDENGSPRKVNGDNGGVKGAVMLGKQEEVPESKEVFGEIVEVGEPRVNDEEFQRKVTEIRAMARKARLQEQESAEARSAQIFERKKLLEQELTNERNRVQGLENLAKDLDDVRRVGVESSDGPDFVANAMKLSDERKKFPRVAENGEPSTSEKVGGDGGNLPSKQPGAALPLRSSSTPVTAKSHSQAQKSSGVKPRIILSAEEARARIAAKRAKLIEPSPSSPLKSETGKSNLGNVQSSTHSGDVKPPAAKTFSSTDAAGLRGLENTTSLSQETPTELSERALRAAGESGSPTVSNTSDGLPRAYNSVPMEKTKKVVTGENQRMSETQGVSRDKHNGKRTRDGATRDSERRSGQWNSKDEEEEMEWMRDDVLREIVFKVQANEEAGREPFHNLNSEQETLFFKGLERKFEREGDEVKKWIKDRVENIDYGSDVISVYDPPESYELKWKEGVDKSPKSNFYSRFNEDRERIMNERRGLANSSPPDVEDTSPADSEEKSPSQPSPSSSAAPHASSSTTSPSIPKKSKTMQGTSRETFAGDSETKSVISSSPRSDQNFGIPHPSAAPSTDNGENGKSKENWDHTKRWAKDLERKYAMERDPATRALMREIGQDLERWITEDEIEAASRLLDKGVEGEEEYVKMHYERTKGKIKKQQEMFGRDAMLNKYSEYKDEGEEIELWWLSLPFVLCIGLRAIVEEEQQTGLYSVDVGAALEGVRNVPNVSYHTVAFQDRGDAQNFCTLINTQPEKLGAEGAELVPFDPKELYKDAKSEGFKVTVIKKGQLQLSVDIPFEEVENRIVELGSASYFNEMISDRVIDMNAVVDEGLGFGQHHQ